MASKTPALSRKARLDAVAAAFEKVASGKAGSVRNGARVQVGKLEGSTRSAWWNWVYRARYNETEARLYGATLIGVMPLIVDKGITYLVMTGEQVARVREGYNA